MGGCSAPNCSNHSRNGFRLFRFPRNEERRKQWLINSRRDNWIPGNGSYLCEVHFEESQFECKRVDMKKLLKATAVPTLFSIPNPPKLIANRRIKGIGLPKLKSAAYFEESQFENQCMDERKNLQTAIPTLTDVPNLSPLLSDKRKKGIGNPKPGSSLEKIEHEKENVSSADLLKRIEALEKENSVLKQQMQEKENKMSSFLSDEQIASLTVDRLNWTNDAVIKGLKLRFALGKHGYNYLRSTGYPAPSYSTLNRRVQNIQLNFGVLHTLFSLLKTKVENMDMLDKNCCILVDEMEIASYQDFDASSKSFIGNTTLGQPGIAKHLTVVMLRGLKFQWKQVVACELTNQSTSGPDMKRLLHQTVDAAREIGLKVRASTSDMGSNNKAMWCSLGVCVSRQERDTSYKIGSSDITIHSFADVPHLLKNMRNAFLSNIFILPQTICNENDLPSCTITSGYLKHLWISEIETETALRSLQHLNRIHLFPTHFSKMNVATAVQLFSLKTAAAIEKSVSLRQLPKEALPSAWWIRMISKWFSIMSARHPKCGITIRNKTKKFEFLQSFVDIMQVIKLGNGWKPLQTGMIMSTISLMNITSELFSDGFTFFLPGRLTQDALENVFSQIRRKSATKPTALQAKRALKLICMSQFISDVNNSNYASDSDYHLFDSLDLSFSLKDIPTTSQGYNNVAMSEPSTSRQVSSHTLPPAVLENDIYFIAGATLNAILNKKNICKICLETLKASEDSTELSVPRYRTLLVEYCDMGGLQKPKSGLYRICREAERVFQDNKDKFLLQELPITDLLVQSIKEKCVNVILPTCCNVKEAVINHYLIVRCKGLKSHAINRKAHNTYFSSASANKKQKIN